MGLEREQIDLARQYRGLQTLCILSNSIHLRVIDVKHDWRSRYRKVTVSNQIEPQNEWYFVVCVSSETALSRKKSLSFLIYTIVKKSTSSSGSCPWESLEFILVKEEIFWWEPELENTIFINWNVNTNVNLIPGILLNLCLVHRKSQFLWLYRIRCKYFEEDRSSKSCFYVTVLLSCHGWNYESRESLSRYWVVDGVNREFHDPIVYCSDRGNEYPWFDLSLTFDKYIDLDE